MIKGRRGVQCPGSAEGQKGSLRRPERGSPAAFGSRSGLHQRASALAVTRTVCTEMFRSAVTARRGSGARAAEAPTGGSPRRTKGRHWPPAAPVRYGRRRRLRPPPGFPAGVDCYRVPEGRRRAAPHPRLVHSPGRRLPGGRSTLRHQIGGDAPHPTHPRRTRGARPTGARGTAYPTRWGSGVGHGGGDALPGDEGAPATAVGTRPGPTVHARRPAWGRFPARGRRGGVAPVGMPRTPTPSHAPHAMCPGDGVGYFPRTRTRTGPGLTSPGPVSCWGRSGGESLPV